MTPSQKLQLKQALERYFLEYKPRWCHYHVDIKEALGIPTADTCLHQRDPVNWIKDGIEPSKPRLILYERFIKTIYPDFEFLPEELSEDIDLGLALARFTGCKDQIYSTDACKKAFFLSGKVYVESKFWDEDRPAGHLLTFSAFRFIPGTPFLRVVQIDLYKSGNGNETVENLCNIPYAEEFGVVEEIARQVSADIMNLLKSRSVFFTNHHVGMFVCTDDSSVIQGIMKQNSIPYHVILKSFSDVKGFAVTKIGRDDSTGFREDWLLCDDSIRLNELIFGHIKKRHTSNAYQQ